MGNPFLVFKMQNCEALDCFGAFFDHTSQYDEDDFRENLKNRPM